MRLLIILLVVLFGLNSCTHQQEFIANKDFLMQLNSYIEYIDSTKEYKDDFDFIYLRALNRDDTVNFDIYLNGGSYTFFHDKAMIKDFLKYKSYHILLIGDYPNEIVKVGLNKHLDIIKDIVQKYYPNDYLKYQKDTLSIGPLIYDYMNLSLTFKKDKLLSIRKQYY